MRAGDQAHPRYRVLVIVLVLLCQHRAQPVLVERSRVVQRRLEPVAHLSIEGVRREVLPTDLPVLGSEPLSAGDGQAVLAHQGVVRGLHPTLTALVGAVPERAVVRERATVGAVMVDDEDVVVRLPAFTIHVGDHEDVGVRVHRLGQPVPAVVDQLAVFWPVRIELFVAERLPVVQRLDFAAVRLTQRPSTVRPRAGTARDVTGDRDTSLVRTSPDVTLGVRGRPARAVVGGAHDATRSPSSSRTSRSTSTSSATSGPNVTG